MTEIWASVWNANAAEIERQAEQCEAAGFDGMYITDSQNLWLECWVALTVAAKATSRLKLGTGVTNPVTRHPAVTADAAASLQEVSGGRVVLGIGRGDSSLAYLGYGPAPLPRFAVYLRQLQSYLRGEEVEFGSWEDPGLPDVGTLGYPRRPESSRIRWLPGTAPKVPVEVAGSGPKVMGLAAALADGVMFGVGADPGRLASVLRTVADARQDAGLLQEPFTTSALLTVVPHPDPAVARRLAAGGVALSSRWSVMQKGAGAADVDPGTRAEFEAARSSYDMVRHGETGTSQAAVLSDALIDRHGIAGRPDHCIERLRQVQALGLDRLVVNTRIRGASPAEQEVTTKLLLSEIVPGLRAS
jgi:5,10-methylenetetrahydromethanopterin reductase